ncbi:substrate-binding domain-containing protein [Methylophaga sp.]|uniref:substrate-binding domain-containing protein n=1 Tax=Methylophaga sp. TaxID=2024840 RepID=UPI0025D45B7F|nr:substrate-binding domain-containing protein [Methylophaga sp.]
MKFRLWLGLGLLAFVSSTAMAVEHLKMSTTTSTDNSGLLAVLNPAFEKQHSAQVDVIAVGTGKALKIGSNGDVDIVFVHAPEAELKYVQAGDFVDRTAVMHNDYVIVGPASDPANIAQAENAAGVFIRIANAQVEFVSRGDDSGTHKKEKALWDNAGIKPSGSWYIAAGQGMGAVLKIADEKGAYALADRGTQIAYADKMNLTVLFEGDEVMFNPYHIMAVNPAKHDHVNYELAKKYIDFVSGPEGQKIIRDFRIQGQQLFHPDAVRD